MTPVVSRLARHRSVHARIRIMVWVLTGLLACVALRIAWLQVTLSSKFAGLARRQHELRLPIPPLRGAIFDRTMRPLATTLLTDSVAADPRHMDRAAREEVAGTLIRVLHLPPAFVQERLRRDKSFVWIKRQISREQALALREADVPWTYLVKEPKRFYPGGSLASHILGFVDIDHQGMEGIEQLHHRELAGLAGTQRLYRDGRGRLLQHQMLEYQPAIDGYDVVLTVDAVIQAVAEAELDRAYHETHAKGGSVVVLNPKTGEILALANRPTFDPNTPGHATPDERRDRAVTDLMEPGSVFKAITASALLDLRLVEPTDTFFCENGQFRTVGKRILHDHTSHGTLTFRQVIALSSNIGTVKAAQRLRPEQLYTYIRRFGFGERSGVDLPGEIAGMISPPQRWSKTSPYAIPIGQEVGATVIQMAVAMAAIANGGTVLRPHVVKAIYDRQGQCLAMHGAALRTRAIAAETADRLLPLLVGVIEEGTGKAAKVQGFLAGGKTGTAQKIDPDGQYSHSKFTASFVGFIPAEDPAVVIAVSLDEPFPIYGGVVCAPVFRRIAEPVMNYLGVLPFASPVASKAVDRPKS